MACLTYFVNGVNCGRTKYGVTDSKLAVVYHIVINLTAMTRSTSLTKNAARVSLCVMRGLMKGSMIIS